MTSEISCQCTFKEWFEPLAVSVNVATALGSIFNLPTQGNLTADGAVANKVQNNSRLTTL